MLYSSHSLYTVRLYTQISPPVHLSYFVILELVPGHVTSDLKPRDSLIAFTNCWNFWWNLLKIVIVTIGKSHINQKVLEGILSLRMKNLAAPLAFPVRLTSILLLERLHFLTNYHLDPIKPTRHAPNPYYLDISHQKWPILTKMDPFSSPRWPFLTIWDPTDSEKLVIFDQPKS